MCVIIHQARGKRQVTYEEFRSSWQTNSDWFGMLYFDTELEKVIAYKNMNMAQSWKEYDEVVNNYIDTDIILHFRMSTHWTTDLANCHPFPCGNSKYLVHNGVFGYHDTTRPTFSDTRLLAESLSKYQWEWLDDDIIREMMNSICSWDKVLVMDSKWDVWFFGAKWVMSEDEQLWASNTSPFNSYMKTKWSHLIPDGIDADMTDEEGYWDGKGYYHIYDDYFTRIKEHDIMSPT